MTEWQPWARIVLNTIGTALLSRGILDASEVGILTGPDAVFIVAGLIGLGVQYVGYPRAKRRGGAT